MVNHDAIQNIRRRSLLLVICLTIFASPTAGQADLSKINKQDLRKFVKILTSDSMQGRGTGTGGERRAQRFIAGRFNQIGLQPFDQNNYSQPFELIQTYWGQVYLKTPKKTLLNFENMVFQGNEIQNDEIETEVIFGGSGTDTELNQIGVTGRWVLVFVKNLRAPDEVTRRLGTRKAAGLILANPDNEKQFALLKNTFKEHALQKRLSFPATDKMRRAPWDTLQLINRISIPNSELKNICGLPPRALAKLIREQRITEVPITKIRVKFERVQRKIETANIIGSVKGKTNKTIIVSAHYDHLGTTGNMYFPGADDNASGTAALLELAEAFSRSSTSNYNIIFLSTSGEEAGLLGSSYFVNRPNFDPKSILCNLNVDMIGRSDEQHTTNQYLYCIGTDQSNELADLVAKADGLFDACGFDYSLNNSHDPTGLFTRSDNYNFYKKGILAIQFFAGLHADYHQTTDTMEKIDFSNLENRVRLIGMVIDLLQREGLKN